jgi:hypothetical protein
MIVIPPVSEYNEWFEAMGKQMWEVAKKSQPVMVQKTESGNKTLVIRCDQKNAEDEIVTYYLHYRMYVNKLYCFVEEVDPREDES